MAWFMRGVQSAVFHYASCAPCTGYAEGRKRRKAAKQAQKLHEKLELEEPGAYRHPGPTMTNPFWDEEIAMGPRPPPRRARKTNTGSSRGITTAGTQNSGLSKGGSSIDVGGASAGDMRLSHDTQEDDEHWNHKRYQREDEDLWGHEEPPLSLPRKASNSLAGAIGLSSRRAGTPKSEDYYTARAPPVNDLHPPVVSLLRPDPADNLWMLQPPPKASIMAGKERASNRSRSGSGASSRVELRLQRQISLRQMQQKIEIGDTLEVPELSRTSSHSTLVTQRRDRCRMPQARPPSATSSKDKKRRDTAIHLDAFSTHRPSGESKDARVRASPTPLNTNLPEIKVDRVRQSRPCLSTVTSADSEANNTSLASNHEDEKTAISDENATVHIENVVRPSHHRYASDQYPDSFHFPTKQRAPLSSSDVSSLNCLQDLVSPHALLKSRFVSAPLVEAKIRLPPSEEDLKGAKKHDWTSGKFSNGPRSWSTEHSEDEAQRHLERDPRNRWSISF